MGRDWEAGEIKYPHRFLRNLGLAFNRRDNIFALHLNPSVIFHLIRGRFDVIVVSGLYHPTMLLAVLSARLLKTPYLVWSESHHHRRRRVSGWKRRIKEPLYRSLISKSAGGLVTGRWAREYLQSFDAPNNIHVVANTIDVGQFQRDVELHRATANSVKEQMSLRGVVVLYVGRLVEVKGIRTLLSAFESVSRTLPDTSLLLVGDGPLMPSVEAWIDSHSDLSVAATGFVQPPQLAAFYALADMFVLPSLSEPWGTVINEAMAAGLPVVTTRVVGASCDLVIDGENGFVIQEADPRALAEALIGIASNLTLRSAMSRTSNQIITRWSIELSADRFVRATMMAMQKRLVTPRAPR